MSLNPTGFLLLGFTGLGFHGKRRSRGDPDTLALCGVADFCLLVVGH